MEQWNYPKAISETLRGATLVTLAAWHASGTLARGEDKPKEGGSDGEMIVDVTGLIYRKTTTKERKARGPKGDGQVTPESWYPQSSDTTNTATPPAADNTEDEDDENSDYPTGTNPANAQEPEPPDGYVKVGWVTTAAEAIANAVVSEPPAAAGWWDPDEDGENSGNNDGTGGLPTGWTWTPIVRTRIDYKPHTWTRKYKFKKAPPPDAGLLLLNLSISFSSVRL